MAVAGALLVVCTTAAYAQPVLLPVVNGDFELGADPGDLTRVAAGAGDITGWTVLPTAVDYIGGYWQASSGQRFVDLDGHFGERGGLAQAVPSVPGTTYIVHFDLAGFPVPGAPYVKTMQVRAAGQVSDYSFSVVGKSAENMGWEHHTFTFTAVAGTTFLEFVSTNDPPGLGPAVDNVNAYPPVPAAGSTWGGIKALYGR